MKKIVVCSVILCGVLFLLSQAINAQEAAKKTETGMKVTEMKLGTDVQNKELVGETAAFTVNQKVYVWMRVTGGTGDSLVITWKHADKSSSMTVGIGSNSWRTWAYKTASAAGDWTVTASSKAGDVLKEATFTVK